MNRTLLSAAGSSGNAAQPPKSASGTGVGKDLRKGSPLFCAAFVLSRWGVKPEHTTTGFPSPRPGDLSDKREREGVPNPPSEHFHWKENLQMRLF